MVEVSFSDIYQYKDELTSEHYEQCINNINAIIEAIKPESQI